MTMSATEIKQLIQEALPDADVMITDLAGDGNHYAAHIISALFKGQSLIQQHRMVYSALQGRMGEDIHALTLTTTAR